MDSPSVKLLFNGVLRGLNNPKGKQDKGLLMPPTPFPSPAHSPGVSPMITKYMSRKNFRRESSSGLASEYQKEIAEFLKLSELYLQKKSEKFVKEDFLKETREYLEVLETEIGHQDGTVQSQTHSIVDYLHYLKAVVVQIVESAEFRDVLIDFAESVQSYLDQDFDSTNYGISKSMTDQQVEVTEGTLSDFEKMDITINHLSNFKEVIEQFKSRFTKTNEMKTATMGLLFLADCWQSLFTPSNFELQLPETAHRLTFLARDLLVYSARNEANLVHDLERSIDSLVYHSHNKSDKFSNWMKSLLLLATEKISCDRGEDSAHKDFWEKSAETLNDLEFKEDLYRFLTASINLLKVINSNDNIQCAWRNALLKLMRIKVQNDEMLSDVVKALSNLSKIALPPIILSDATFFYQLVDPILFFDNLMPSSFTCHCEGDNLTIKIETIEGKLENVICNSTRKDLPLVSDETSLGATFNFGAEISVSNERQSMSLNSIKCTINGVKIEGEISIPNESFQLGLESMIERVVVDVMQDVSTIAKQFYDSIYEATSTSQTQSAR